MFYSMIRYITFENFIQVKNEFETYFDHLFSTHWGRVTHFCIGNQGHHCLRYWLVNWLVQSHYLNQGKNIEIGPLGTNCNKISIKNLVFINENVFENLICKMLAILFPIFIPNVSML